MDHIGVTVNKAMDLDAQTLRGMGRWWRDTTSALLMEMERHSREEVAGKRDKRKLKTRSAKVELRIKELEAEIKLLEAQTSERQSRMGEGREVPG